MAAEVTLGGAAVRPILRGQVVRDSLQRTDAFADFALKPLGDKAQITFLLRFQLSKETALQPIFGNQCN
ncbi:hypothetical protein [Zoogloea sp.]|uniref:hypothetical protein n=1 Tax=Zoogloea sp. TaxID=49181 RepID=UPI00321FB7A4